MSNSPVIIEIESWEEMKNEEISGSYSDDGNGGAAVACRRCS